ncbi:hypothetical protein [Methanosarcina sp.]|uniref:hypothetical protein n=1 Tax=Methanosarcina sp. TaxID=2213 RepID=UPI003C762A64
MKRVEVRSQLKLEVIEVRGKNSLERDLPLTSLLLLIFRESGVRNGEPHFRFLFETSPELKLEEWQKPQCLLTQAGFRIYGGQG